MRHTWLCFENFYVAMTQHRHLAEVRFPAVSRISQPSLSFVLVGLLLASLSASSLQETEEPIVECQECETEVSPSQTGGSSGDLGDISSFSSKASSSHHTSSGTSLSAMHSSGSSGRGAGPLKGKNSGTEAADFALPSSRGGPGKLRCIQGLQRDPAGAGLLTFEYHSRRRNGINPCLFLPVWGCWERSRVSREAP